MFNLLLGILNVLYFQQTFRTNPGFLLSLSVAMYFRDSKSQVALNLLTVASVAVNEMDVQQCI